MLIRRRFRSNIHPISITDPISAIYIHSAPLVAVYPLIYMSVRDSKLIQAKPYCPRRSCTRCALAYKKAVNIAVVRGIHWVRQLPYARLTKVSINALQLLLQAHTDIFFRYPGGFFEFICVFSYACFLICIQFLMFFLLRVDRFSFDSDTWILISRRSDLSGDCVQDAWFRFYPPQSWKPFSQQKLFVPGIKQQIHSVQTNIRPKRKKILVLENPKTYLPNLNQSTKIAYSNLTNVLLEIWKKSRKS